MRSISIALMHILLVLVAAPVSAIAAGATPDATLAGHKERVLAVAFSPDGSRLASASDGGALKIWDTATDKEVASVDGVASNSNEIRFTPDGKTIVTLGSNSNVLVIDVRTGKPNPPIAVSDLDGGPAAMDLSPDGKTIAIVGRGGLRLFDLATGRPSASYAIHPQYGVEAVAFSPDGKFVASASTDHTSLLIDCATGKIVRTFQLVLNGEGVVFSTNGKTLFVYSSDRLLTAFNVETGESQKLLDRGVPVTTMSTAPDGKTLAVAGTGRAPWFVSLPDGAVSDDRFDCEDRVMSATLSADGKWMAGGANEGNVYLWRILR